MKRPRFAMRFGLGTLLLALVAMSVALAWGTSIGRERRAVLEALKADYGVSYVTAAEQREALAGVDLPFLVKDVEIPRWRELLGDEAIAFIYFTPDRRPTEEVRERIGRVFPETEIVQQEYAP